MLALVSTWIELCKRQQQIAIIAEAAWIPQNIRLWSVLATDPAYLGRAITVSAGSCGGYAGRDREFDRSRFFLWDRDGHEEDCERGLILLRKGVIAEATLKSNTMKLAFLSRQLRPLRAHREGYCTTTKWTQERRHRHRHSGHVLTCIAKLNDALLQS